MSRFVSAGTIDAATGQAVAADAGPPSPAGKATSPVVAGGSSRREEWEAVSRELEEQRRKREEEARWTAEGGEKSLYAILQENKAAKQAAFEEANKIKNQFRPLDDDEVEFLDEVQASVRREEERMRREVQDNLDRFREAQRKGSMPTAALEDADDDSAAGGIGTVAPAADEDWAVGAGGGRKRRKKDDGRAGVLKGVVRRKTSEPKPVADTTAASKEPPPAQAGPKAMTPANPPSKPSLGLVDYGSDDSD